MSEGRVNKIHRAVLVLQAFVIDMDLQFCMIWIRRAEESDIAQVWRLRVVLLRQMASTLMVIIERAMVTTLAASGTSVTSCV